MQCILWEHIRQESKILDSMYTFSSCGVLRASRCRYVRLIRHRCDLRRETCLFHGLFFFTDNLELLICPANMAHCENSV